MSDTGKSASVNGGWSVPWFLVGAVLYFGTSADNTWWGIHTKHAGGIILVVSLAMLALVILVALAVLIGVAIAGSRKRRW